MAGLSPKNRFLWIALLFFICPPVIYYSIVTFDDFRVIGDCHPLPLKVSLKVFSAIVAIFFPLVVGYLSWQLDELFLLFFSVGAFGLSGYAFIKAAKNSSGGGGVHLEQRVRALVPHLSANAKPIASAIADFHHKTGRLPNSLDEIEYRFSSLGVCGMWSKFSYQKENDKNFVLYVEYGESEATGEQGESSSSTDGFAWYSGKQTRSPGVCCYGSPTNCFEFYCQLKRKETKWPTYTTLSTTSNYP